MKRTSTAGVQVGDLVTLTHTAAGLTALKVRIAELTVDKPDSPEVAIRWKEGRGWLNAIPTAVAPDDVEPEGEYSAQPLLANVVLELPYGYLREAKPSLIFLPVRGDPLTNGFHAWWERTADSLVQVAGGSSFAIEGTLNAALDAGTLADASIDITFTDDDWELEETTLEEATTTQPLQVFIGGEIMVGYDAQLTGPKRYTLKVLREWFGTRAETRASGATACVLQVGLEKPGQRPIDRPAGRRDRPQAAGLLLHGRTAQPQLRRNDREENMSTIAPGRLLNVTDAASFVALSQQNWVIASEEIFRRVPTYQNGSPNTLNGPPTSGAWSVGDFWRDQNRAEFVCTVAGTPGTWRQMVPASVIADPASGTFPAGYLIVNVADGGLKRHAGALSWEVQDGATSILEDRLPQVDADGRPRPMAYSRWAPSCDWFRARGGREGCCNQCPGLFSVRAL